MALIERWRLATYSFPTPRVVGDVRLTIDALPIGTIEIVTSAEATGVGYFWSPTYPAALPDPAELERAFAAIGREIAGHTAEELLSRQPLTGNPVWGTFDAGVDMALWDLRARELEVPLFRLLGGTERRVRAYASGLEYPLSDDEAVAFFGEKAALGYTAFKLKVGNSDVEAELRRIRAIVDVLGEGAIVLVDANEAWSGEETVRRLQRYAAEGINVCWIEDPCPRDDVEALRLIRREVPDVLVNSGEYLDEAGRANLIVQDALDVVPVHGHISASLRLAHQAKTRGLRVAVGNSTFDIGVHLGAAIGDVMFIEDSCFDYRRFTDTPIAVKDGYAQAPETPGHGIRLSGGADPYRTGLGDWQS